MEKFSLFARNRRRNKKLQQVPSSRLGQYEGSLAWRQWGCKESIMRLVCSINEWEMEMVVVTVTTHAESGFRGIPGCQKYGRIAEGQEKGCLEKVGKAEQQRPMTLELCSPVSVHGNQATPVQ